MQRIAVISDTHGLLRPEVIQIVVGCDAIIHGGDINNQKILDQLSALAPLYVVRGNNDKESITIQIEDCVLFVVHNKKFVPSVLHDIDVVIFGHSHKYAEQMIDGRLWLNPGNCGKRRFDQETTLAILTINGKELSVEKIIIPVRQ